MAVTKRRRKKKAILAKKHTFATSIFYPGPTPYVLYTNFTWNQMNGQIPSAVQIKLYFYCCIVSGKKLERNAKNHNQKTKKIYSIFRANFTTTLIYKNLTISCLLR
jgi:hypothetical protein